MIAPRIVKEIRRLLNERRLSQRKIAELIGVSRGTVGAVASGKRPDRLQPRRAADYDESLKPSGPPRRCPSCGGMVYMPCRVCQTRAAIAEKRPPQWQFSPLEEPLGLELKDNYLRRYEQLRTARLNGKPSSNPVETYDDASDEDYCELNPDDVLDAFELDDEPVLQN